MPDHSPISSLRPRLLVTGATIQAIVKPPADEFDTVVVSSDFATARPVLEREGRGIEVMLTSGSFPVDGDCLALLPDLRLIVVLAAGMSGIDFDVIRRRGIAVTNAGDTNAEDVADFALTLFLSHRRDILSNHAYVRADRWPGARRPTGRAISRERVGLVGLGHIGKAVGRRLEPFGCAIGWWGPRPKPDIAWRRHDTLMDLASWASTLIIAAKADEETRDLISADIIAALGPSGLIVNVSRGFVIDEPAMVSALRDGRLGGAALDVFVDEPILGSRWSDVPNVLMAPHVAGSTDAAFGRMVDAALANIRAYFRNEALLHRVI